MLVMLYNLFAVQREYLEQDHLREHYKSVKNTVCLPQFVSKYRAMNVDALLVVVLIRL